MLKKIIKLNADDLWLYAGVEGGLFLLIEIIICGVMYFARPEDSVTISICLMPIIAGFVSLIAGISHVGVTFDQAVAFGQTRRRAMGLTIALECVETAFGIALGAVLAVLERFVCPNLWAWMAGAEGWVTGRAWGTWDAAPSPDGTQLLTGRFYENMAGELLPLPENTLIINTFTLDWYWWLLAFVIGVGGGLIVGALIQRYGSKGGWIIWCICVLPMLLTQLLPIESYVLTAWFWPLMGLLFAAGIVWALWSMLHSVVRT